MNKKWDLFLDPQLALYINYPIKRMHETKKNAYAFYTIYIMWQYLSTPQSLQICQFLTPGIRIRPDLDPGHGYFYDLMQSDSTYYYEQVQKIEHKILNFSFSPRHFPFLTSQNS
jgi:hypothetical protein